jgi:hypothetical protein
MHIERNIQKISLVFFFIIGLMHLLAYLMLSNGYMPDIATAVKTILEIPFILTAAIYGFVSLKIGFELPEKKHKISNIIFIFLIIILFAMLIYINLFIPDRV